MAERRLTAVLTARDEASRVLRNFGALVGVIGTVQLGRKLVQGFGAALTAAGNFESQLVRLDNALKVSGNLTTQNQEDLREFAAELTRTSQATETQIVQSLAMNVALGGNVEAAKALTEAATDLSAATGIDLQTAFRQTTRTLGGYGGELGELLPQLKDLTKEQLQAGEAARIIQEQFGGASAAVAETFEGAVNNLNSALDQLRVQIGGPIIDVVREFINRVLIPTVDQMTKAVSASDSFRQSVLSVGVALVEVVQTGLRMVALINQNREAIAAALGIFILFQASLRGMVIRLGAVTAALVVARKLIEEFGDQALEENETLLEMDRRLEGVKLRLESMRDPTQGVATDFQNLIDQVTVTTDKLIEADEAVRTGITVGFTNLSDVLGAQNKEIEGVGDTLGRTFRGAAVSGVVSFGDILVDAARRGKFAFDDFLISLISRITQAIAQALILRAVLSLFSFGAGAAAGSTGGFVPLGTTGGFVGAHRAPLIPGAVALDEPLAAAGPAVVVQVNAAGAVFLDESVPARFGRQLTRIVTSTLRRDIVLRAGARA